MKYPQAELVSEFTSFGACFSSLLRKEGHYFGLKTEELLLAVGGLQLFLKLL
jgi:hypothetical protein